jgi:hypothetical protein
MDDDAFLAALQTGALPREELTHAAHLRLALLCRGQPGRAREILLRYVEHVGARGKYNETLTQVWIRLVDLHPAEKTLDQLLETPLADSSLPLRHYSRERLWSDEARAHFVEPDLRPLPAVTPAALTDTHRA